MADHKYRKKNYVPHWPDDSSDEDYLYDSDEIDNDFKSECVKYIIPEYYNKFVAFNEIEVILIILFI